MARRASSTKPQAKDTVALGDFARCLKQAMEARDWSPLQLAEAIGAEERTVELWLAAQVEPQLFRAAMGAQALGTSVDVLLGASPYTTPASSWRDAIGERCDF